MPHHIVDKLEPQMQNTLANVRKVKEKTGILLEELLARFDVHSRELIAEENIELTRWTLQLVELLSQALTHTLRIETVISYAEDREVLNQIKS